ncbi:MAG: AAC(3) family N-acetyltransferase [Propionibacteriaceae bacterium]|nr:AAC(3) family N-acetyltransferase [Propionibacteriaceae bacterium]
MIDQLLEVSMALAADRRPVLPVTVSRAVAELRRCGVAEGDVVLAHSALRPFGEVEGGAATLATALREAVGPTGTVVAPAFTFRHEVAENPVIDPLNDRSEMGAISEAIRLMPGALRSTAYRHSFSAIGPQAATITATDPALSVFDLRSTFGRLLALDARIVLLGLTYVSCTSFHFGEYLVQIPDRHVVERPARLRRADGELVPAKLLDYQPRPTDDGREYEHEHDFDRAGALLEQAGQVAVGAIGNAVIRVFAMRDLIHLLLDRYGLEPDIFYLDPRVGPTRLADGVSVFTGDLRDGAGRLVETNWSCLDPALMHR